MSSEVWRSSDIFHLLRSLYAAKIAALEIYEDRDRGRDPLTAQSAQFYQQGCQMAVQLLLLALGYIPQDFYQAEPDETACRGHGREIWMRPELGNLIASIYDAFTSRTGWFPLDAELANPAWTMRHAGFYDMLIQVLQALSIPPEALEQGRRPTPPPLPRLWVEEDFDEG